MSKRSPEWTRRSFLSNTAALSGAAALTAASYARVIGANDRIGVGFLGYGLIGKRHVMDFQEQPDVNMVAVADVHRGRRDEAVGFVGGTIRGYQDFRQVLDSPDVDAVVISTPDHWHALMTMLACAAGKDVYVEKPATLFPQEGRWMRDVATRHQRVVQVGTQQRSGKHYQLAKELIQQGHIGQVMSVRMQSARNIVPGFGSPPDSGPPAELDYDQWLGPAPLRPFNPQRAIYHFRWFWDYSGGQMTNLGQHSLDIVDWILGVDSLRAVTSAGGRFCLTNDNGETPDTQDAIFEFDGWTATWSHREGAKGETPTNGLIFYGTRGSLGLARGGFTVSADDDLPPQNSIPQFTGAHPVGGPMKAEVAGPPRFKTTALVDKSGDTRAQFKDHVRNFLDCIKSRATPISDLDSGQRVSTICHLANLSLRLGRKLRWDGVSETILDDDEARQQLTRAYRAPWDTTLKELLGQQG